VARKREETAIGKQRQTKYVSTAMNQHAAIKELLENKNHNLTHGNDVFYTVSAESK
jgi:hypothetical protein